MRHRIRLMISAGAVAAASSVRAATRRATRRSGAANPTTRSAQPITTKRFSMSAFTGGLALLILGLAGMAASAADLDSAPHRLVAQTATDLAALIRDSQGYAKENPERFYAAVDALLSPVVDFNGFARGVMAAHYKQATPEQRTRFAEAFKWSLIRAYALALTDFTEGEVMVLPPNAPPRHPRRRSVKTEIHTGTEIYPVIYTTTLGPDGAWRIGNISIAGVNIGLTYRSQFASMAADSRYGGDLNRIIDAWAKFVGKGPESFGENPATNEEDAAADPYAAAKT